MYLIQKLFALVLPVLFGWCILGKKSLYNLFDDWSVVQNFGVLLVYKFHDKFHRQMKHMYTHILYLLSLQEKNEKTMYTFSSI